MKEIIEDKGRVRPVVEGDFQCDEFGNSTRDYQGLSIVGFVDGESKSGYISKKSVPIGTPITDEEYWYPFNVILVPKGDKGDKGDTGAAFTYDMFTPEQLAGLIGPKGDKGDPGYPLILRVSPDGQSLEISDDGGQTWYTFEKNFNKLRVLGYVDNISKLPKAANIGDIYGVLETPVEPGEDAIYSLYINTVKDWLKDYTITKVYDYDTELPASVVDGTTVLVPVDYLTLDKQKIDGYKVYRFSVDDNGWILILDTAEIYTSKDDIINRGDNKYALVQGEEPNTYDLYIRDVDWIYFGTNASITYLLIQNIQEGDENNILSGKAVKDAINVLSKGTSIVLSANPAIVYKGVSTSISLSSEMKKSTPANIKIFDGSTVLANGSNNPLVYSSNFTLNADKTFTTEGTSKNVIFDDDVLVQARYPIYYGFAANAASLAVAANRYSPTTTAAHTYTKTNYVDDQHFYILVPNDILGLSVFTMGGAPFVMNQEQTETIGGIVYKVYESAYTYNSGTTLTVSAS